MTRIVLLLLLAAAACSKANAPPTAQPTEAGARASGHVDDAAAVQSLSPFELAELQTHVAAFNGKVRQLPGFSDLWIEHRPRWRVIAAFTDPPPAMTVRALAPAPIRNRIEVRRAKRTQSQIGAGMDTIAAALNRAGFPYTASYSPKTERFAVTVGTAEHVAAARHRAPAIIAGDLDVQIGPLPSQLTPEAPATVPPAQPPR